MELKINRNILIAVGIVLILLVLALLIYSLFNGDSDEPTIPPGSVEQPVGHDKGTKVRIEDDVSSDTQFEEEMYVYKVDSSGHIQNVRSFLDGMNKSSWYERSFDNSYFMWVPEKTENFYIIDYDQKTEVLNFRFPDPVSTRRFTDGSVLTDEDLEKFMTNFFKEYLGLDYQFTTDDIIRSRDGIRIEANRIIDETDLHRRSADRYSDFVEINDRGDITRGQLLLMDYQQPGAKAEIINPGIIGSVINRTDYPKDFHQGPPIGFDPEYPDVDISDPNYIGDAVLVPEGRRVEQVNSCVAQSMEIVYFFFTTASDELSPTYRIDCLGKTEIEGVEYDVPVVVYANALDPNLVYVPEGVR